MSASTAASDIPAIDINTAFVSPAGVGPGRGACPGVRLSLGAGAGSKLPRLPKRFLEHAARLVVGVGRGLVGVQDWGHAGVGAVEDLGPLVPRLGLEDAADPGPHDRPTGLVTLVR